MATSTRGDLRETLIAAALAMLEGGEEPSLRAVARAAGVSAMAPYRHFQDKAALLAAVAQRGFAMLYEALSAADQSSDARGALLAQGIAYVAFARAHPALFRLMFASPLGRLVKATEDAGTYGILAQRVAELVPDDAASATLACWSIVHGLATLELDGRLPGISLEHERGALMLFVAALGSTGTVQ